MVSTFRQLTILVTHSANPFNPRPRTGGDLADRDDVALLPLGHDDSSIDTPVGTDAVSDSSGFGSQWRMDPVDMPRFNPRPRTGGDSDRNNCSNGPGDGQRGRFQDVRPRTGGDLDGLRSNLRHLATCGFNPRPRTGGDTYQTCLRVVRVLRDWCFNPRPRTGGDSNGTGATRSPYLMFQSTPPHRGRPTLISLSRAPILYQFQSTPPHRGRLGERLALAVGGAWFQSTPPHRGRLDFTR